VIRRNTAGQPILIGPLELIADGAAVTSGAAISTRIGGTTAPGGGTLAHVASGVWEYTPTQAETDTPIFGLILSATGSRPIALTALTTTVATQAANGVISANTVQLAGQTVNATAAVTFPASVGTSTYAGADTSGTTTLLHRVPGAVALAGTAPTWYAAPPAGSTIAGEVWSASERKLSEFNFSVTLSAGQKIGLVDGSIGPASFGVPADSPGPANDPISWLRRIYQRSFNRRTRNRTTGVVTIFAGDNTTPVTTETQTTAGDLDTVTRAV
jgi:hypothetical protein